MKKTSIILLFLFLLSITSSFGQQKCDEIKIAVRKLERVIVEATAYGFVTALSEASIINPDTLKKMQTVMMQAGLAKEEKAKRSNYYPNMAKIVRLFGCKTKDVEEWMFAGWVGK